MTDVLSPKQRSHNMRQIRSAGTTPELHLREIIREVFPRRKIVERPDLPGRPDFFLPGLGLALFADGCFWHRCPKHGRIPESNRDYWVPKLERNRTRGREVLRALHLRGLRTVRVWEHELKGSRADARRKVRRARRRVGLSA